MIAYGSSETQPCGCPEQQPFCTTCSARCDKKIDASCAVYHLLEPNAINHLTCLGLPNGVTVEAFMEAVDAAICAGIDVTPVIYTLDTPSIDISGDGTVGTPLQADAVISADAGNTISIHSDGLYAAGGAVDCDSVQQTFVTDTAQKNTVTQTAYDFLITGTAGCQLLSPPLSYAVVGTNRKSAFGTMEWYATLAAANTAAVSGETVVLYKSAAENLTAKNGVNYLGVGKVTINDLNIGNIITSITNLVVAGTLSCTGECTAVNSDITGLASFGGNAKWEGGKFLDNTTVINIVGSSYVSNIYSEKAIGIAQDATLINFRINYAGANSTALNSSVTGTANLLITKGTITAPNIINNNSYAGMSVVSLGNATVTVTDVDVVTGNARAIYLQCGEQANTPTLIAHRLTGRSIANVGLFVAASQTLGVTDNTSNCVVSDSVGYSTELFGMYLINGSVRHCKAYSEENIAMYAAGAENPSTYLYIIDCVAESKATHALQMDRNVYVAGGTYISRGTGFQGSPIFISATLIAALDPSGTAGYFISGVKTIQRSSGDYAISVGGIPGVVARISNCEFLSEYVLTSVPGIDPAITLRTVIANGPAINNNRS